MGLFKRSGYNAPLKKTNNQKNEDWYLTYIMGFILISIIGILYLSHLQSTAKYQQSKSYHDINNAIYGV
jgi:hypothetical protein